MKMKIEHLTTMKHKPLSRWQSTIRHQGRMGYYLFITRLSRECLPFLILYCALGIYPTYSYSQKLGYMRVLDSPNRRVTSSSRLIYTYTNQQTRRFELHLVNSDGLGDELLTTGTDNESFGYTPSPNGQYIAFLADTQDEYQKGEAKWYIQDRQTQNIILVSPSDEFQFADPAVWSPDSKQFLFLSHKLDGSIYLYLFDIDRSSVSLFPTQVTTGNITSLAWSSDGKYIAFIVALSESSSRLEMMSANGSDLKILIYGRVNLDTLVWSPDSHGIIALNNNNNDSVLVYVDISSAAETPIASNLLMFRMRLPSWSPNGQILLFVRTTLSGDILYKVARDNFANQTQVTAVDSDILNSLSWSPDGQKIVFTAESGNGSSQIYVVGADGSDQKQITSIGNNQDPTWSPDGRQIAFSSDRDGIDANGNGNVYVMNADGSSPVRISAKGHASGANWLP